MLKRGLIGAGGVGGADFVRTLGGSGNDSTADSAIDSLGNIILCGATASSGAGGNDGLVVKYSPDLNVLWQRTLGGTGVDQFMAVAVDSQDNILVVGYSTSTTIAQYAILFAKYSPDGTLLWQKATGSDYFDFGYGVAVDSGDNVIVYGIVGITSTTTDMFVGKYSSSGSAVWLRTITISGSESANAVAVDSADNIIVAGGPLGRLFKISSAGSLVWQRSLSGGGLDYFTNLVLDSSDSIVAVGYTSSIGAGNQDTILVRYSSSGSLLYQRILGGTGTDICEDITLDSSQNILICGRTNSVGAGSNDFLIAKYTLGGSIIWSRTLGGIDSDLGYGVVVDGNDDVVVSGNTQSSGAGGNDILIARLPSDPASGGAFDYADADLTDASATLTGATPTSSLVSRFFPLVTPTLTSGTPSLTEM